MQASAFIVGPADGPGTALADLARSLGFQTVAPYTSLTLAEQQAQRTPLCFFLFAAVDDMAQLAEPAGAIRFAPHRRVRFSPLIYFSESPSLDGIRRCIDMGFDDVITVPFTRARVLERLRRQVGRPLTYYETPGYFGPDRRRQLGGATTDHALRGAGGKHRRIEIIRTTENGATVLRDDLHTAA